MNTNILNTHEIIQRMRVHFAAPEYAIFFEVMASTGFGANRRTDAVAISLYPSRGLMINGFEFKSSRADWLRELKDASKAEEVFGFCDYWWLVAGDPDIVKDGELPEPWGLILPNGEGLRVKKKAPKLQPKTITRGFMAAIARRAQESAAEAIEDRVRQATWQVREDAQRDVARARDGNNSRFAELAKKVQEFERASGIDISRGWNRPEKIGGAVKMILDGGLQHQAERAKNALNVVDGLQSGLRALIAALPHEVEKEDMT